jgi:hypothetical protein
MNDLVAEAVREHWGEKCPDYSVGCYCCEAWKQYATLTARLAEAEARVSELTKQLALRCCAENCDKEELLTADREQRAELDRLRGLLREVLEEGDWFDNCWEVTLARAWHKRVEAALEGKP